MNKLDKIYDRLSRDVEEKTPDKDEYQIVSFIEDKKSFSWGDLVLALGIGSGVTLGIEALIYGLNDLGHQEYFNMLCYQGTIVLVLCMIYWLYRKFSS